MNLLIKFGFLLVDAREYLLVSVRCCHYVHRSDLRLHLTMSSNCERYRPEFCRAAAKFFTFKKFHISPSDFLLEVRSRVGGCVPYVIRDWLWF